MDNSDLNNCPFCQIARRKMPAVILDETKDVLAIMDLYPATPGHILVLPKQHIENICSLPNEIGTQIMMLAIALAKAITSQLQPNGLNLIQANGVFAGQTVNHFHLHLVPRYQNDGVILKFGHGSVLAEIRELVEIAAKIKQGLG